MTPDEHKRLRYRGRVMMAACGAEVLKMDLPDAAVESIADGLAEGLLEMLRACLTGPAAYQILQRLADDASRHVGAGRG